MKVFIPQGHGTLIITWVHAWRMFHCGVIEMNWLLSFKRVLGNTGHIYASEEKVMRGQSHLHVIMSVMSYDSHECSHWWNRVAWHGAAQFTALSGWHRCQSLCGAPHLNLSTRLKWAKTVAVHLPSGFYVDWKSSDEIFQMCVNSICAFLNPSPIHLWCPSLCSSGLFLGQTLWIIHRLKSL